MSRKNSKRLPGKTLKPLAGKPMIAYTFEAARNAKLLERCWIFSDDADAIALAKKMGIEAPPFDRPEAVSTDQATTEETVRCFLSRFSRESLPDYLMLLQATSPLRTSFDIDRSIELLFGHSTLKADGVVSVCQPAKPLSWLYEQNPGTLGLTPLKHDSAHWKMPNGAIYILKPGDLLDGKSLLEGEIIGYEMPWQRSADIDTIEDFLYAEAFLEHSDTQTQAALS